MSAKIKLNAASGGGSISIQAPSSSSNNRVISLPDIADGTLVTSESTLDATKLSGNLPAISGANLTGIAGNIIFAEAVVDGAGGSRSVTRSTGFGSITDNGTGDYTLALSSAQPDSNYTVVGAAGYTSNNNDASVFIVERRGSNGDERPNTTTAVNFGTVNDSLDARDVQGNIHIACMRG